MLTVNTRKEGLRNVYRHVVAVALKLRRGIYIRIPVITSVLVLVDKHGFVMCMQRTYVFTCREYVLSRS